MNFYRILLSKLKSLEAHKTFLDKVFAKMEKILNPVNLQRLYKTLQSLDYYPIKIIDRTTEWRKSQYHLFTKPFGKKGLKLKLHKDIWEKPPPTPKHKTKYKGKDIEQELQKIQQKYREKTKEH